MAISAIFQSIALGWRRITGIGETELVPQARLSGPMPWVIAIMVALTVIALSAGLALHNTAQATAAELAGGVTVQIVEAEPESRDAQAQASLKALRAMPGIVSARLVPRKDVDVLIEPWLGSDVVEAEEADGSAGYEIEIPIPALIDARVKGAVTPKRLENLRRTLGKVAPSARIDAQSTWLKPVFEAIQSLQWLAIALIVLLTIALAAAVLLAARTALGANRDTIEIVHLLGGTDSQIARVFQRSIGVDAAGGGAVGMVLAVVVILFLGRRFAGLGAGMVDNGALGVTDWALLALVPVTAVLLAMVTARITVIRSLRKIL